MRGLNVIDTLFRDVRYAGRTLRRSPGFTLVAIVTIVLGIFGPTVTFTMVKAWILDPLPFARPNERRPAQSGQRFRRRRFGECGGLPRLAAQRAIVRGDRRLPGGQPPPDRRDRAERVRGAMVPGFFRVLGIHARLGRLFDEIGTDAGQSHLLVISHMLWRDRFRQETSAIGRPVRLTGRTTPSSASCRRRFSSHCSVAATSGSRSCSRRSRPRTAETVRWWGWVACGRVELSKTPATS